MSNGALGGVKVVDFSHARAGPECTLLLADMGADVIKVERPEGDGSRHWGPSYEGERIDFLSLNRNKRGIAVDLSNPHQRGKVRHLLREADVVVQNFRPGVMERFGLGAEQVLAEYPGMVYCTISGYGAHGPLAGERCYDQVIQGYSGFMSVTGTSESGPVRAGVPLADLTAGVFAALGICGALYERSNSGRGQHVQTSLLQSLVGLMSFHALDYLLTGSVPGLAGNHHPTITPTGTFAAADGELTIAIANDAMWGRFCAVLGREHLTKDPRFADNELRRANRDDLIVEIETLLAARRKDEWVRLLREAGVPAGPVHDVGEALSDQQVRANELVVELEHPRMGKMEMLGFPFQLSRTPLSVRSHPPALGEHNEEFGLDAIPQKDSGA